MQTVNTLSLNGKAYKLEEPGYARLRAYLDEADRVLAQDPDRTEILKDLEQAIGEKCAKTLDAHKDVVSAAEIEQIVAEMGPVEAAEMQGGASTPSAPVPKKLYQIRDGALIAGVCNGIAAYLNLDVTVVRIAFVVLIFLTGGFWILLYLVMMILVPSADTFEQRAAARGAPFNAQQVIERAKLKYEQFRARRSTT